MTQNTAATVLNLSVEDRQDWATQEQIVRDGLKGFVEVGKALTIIHAKSYYQPLSWKVYLKQAFSLSPGRANRIMGAAQIHEKLKKAECVHLPANEHVAATLFEKWGHEKDEVIVEVWNAICARRDDKPVTANLVGKVTGERNGAPKEEKRDPAVVKLEKLRETLGELNSRTADDLPPELLGLLESLKKQLQEVLKSLKKKQTVPA